ncbi:MAG: succinylglutamate desuccinylase/aspartoacylase family protein [Lachnospiraceae bacterium]|nr:succinylglutamate desuccinylase/aspartoacylase family protein [Lachnospiraceae bacterium]
MKKKVIYELKALYREPMQVTGYEFGEGQRSVCVVGSMRGNEIQQMYACSRLIQRLQQLEEQQQIVAGKSILVVPCVNSYSMNIGKRFWSTDNTDINRMFPGYDLGETTQRIASGVFDAVKAYDIGIQFASNYMSGRFLPHIRMMQTGFEDIETAKKFSFPYVITRNTRPFDTTTLNYNWQIWETRAFSVYTTDTDEIDRKSAADAVKGIEQMLNSEGILHSSVTGGYHYNSQVLSDDNLLSVRCSTAGIYENKVYVGEEVYEGQLLAEITDPYEGTVLEQLTAPADGTVFFQHKAPLIYADTAALKLV